MSADLDYSAFLNGWNPATDGLAMRALMDVQDSGLSPDILERAGVTLFRGNSGTLKKRLGFSHMDGNPILSICRLIEFPYVDNKGAIARYEYKLCPAVHFVGEEKPRKYLQGKGQLATPYVVPDVWTGRDKVNKALWITEGVKKTLKLIQHGRLAIGLSGVWNFKGSRTSEEPDNKHLWADLEAFRWTGRTVYVGFDSDLWTNPQVRRALYELTFKLYCSGALIRLPIWRGAKGIDDYLRLMEDPEAALAQLETESRDLEAFLSVDHRGEIIKALYRMRGLQGLAEKTLVSIVAKRLGLKAKDILNDMSRQRHSELKQAVDNSLYPYFINEAVEVCRWRRERDGTEVQTTLSNFVARIVEDVTIDTGLEVSRRFTIEGASRDKVFPKVHVPTSQFPALSWVLNHWGNDAIIRAGQITREYLREFIQVHSNREGVKRLVIFGHTGWRQVDGTWCYLMANGAIGGNGVSVELPTEFLETGRYCLPPRPQNEKEAIETAIFSFLGIGKPDICYPALAYVFLSPLTTLLDPMPSFSMYFHGERDSLKTAVSIIMLAFFGAHSKRGLSNFDSTSNQIMHRATVLKDTLMLVDDYYPSPGQREAAAKETIAQRIIRDVGNRTGRGRLNPDASEKPIPSPRGMMLITGEELPGLQSTLSRIVAIEFSRGDIDLAKLTQLQKQAILLPHAMTSYILWLQERITSIQESFHEAFQHLRKEALTESTSKKIPEHVAYLQFAWTTLLSWAVDKGVIDEGWKLSATEIGWNTFMRVADRHTRRVEQQDPVKMFFEIIDALLTQGRLRIDHKEAGYKEHLGGDAGELIGYYDENFYYLLPAPSWHAVQTYLRLEGEHFPFSKPTLYDLLEKRGYLETRGNERVLPQRIGGKVQRVLKLKRSERDVFSEIEEEAFADEV